MKLRLLDDSIRLRLSSSEVVAAVEHGVVESQTRFPDGSALKFALEALPADAGATSASAAYENDRLVVRLPAAEISAWANDDSAVSLRGELALHQGEQLTLLVEKDFRCLTPRPDEDQSDLFTNPDANC